MSIILKNSRLTAEIQLPGEFYHSSRFDHSTLITSLRLDDQWEFLSREMADGSLSDRRGHGMVCEFGIRTPWGYEDCEMGDYFPKIGVGWVKRTLPGPYDFYRHEPDFLPLDYTHQSTSDSLELQADSGERRGYRWFQKRRWTLEGINLICKTWLENRGQKSLLTTEYAHNFVSPGGGILTPFWELETGFSLPTPATPWGDRGCWQRADNLGHRLGFTRQPLDQFGSGKVSFHPPVRQPSEQFWWNLKDRASGCGIREELIPSGTPYWFEFWGSKHTFSPELFHTLKLEPGESAVWERRYSLGREESGPEA